MTVPADLAELAHAYSVQTSYVDIDGHRQHASTDTLLVVLSALGASLADASGAASALRERRQGQWGRLAPPVIIAWDGALDAVALQIPAGGERCTVRCRLLTEDGGSMEWSHRWGDLELVESEELEGVRYERRLLPLSSAEAGQDHLPPYGALRRSWDEADARWVKASADQVERLPLGYHRLHLQIDAAEANVLVIAAPPRAYKPADVDRRWGIFTPPYALHSSTSWGVGDFADLGSIVDWVAGLGGSVVATTPLLASFLDEPCEPSPYSPVSRLFWNELYVDPGGLPEMRSPTSLIDDLSLHQELDALRATTLVDYPRAMALKRRVLAAAAERLFGARSERRAAFEAFIASHPDVERYARFRALAESLKATWPSWPERLRAGDVRKADCPASSARYHEYAQWVAHDQLTALSSRAEARGVDLLFDLPLGAHPEGYDTWTHQGLFAAGMNVGAPPDPGFRTGQDWGFPPVLPEASRAEGHDYFTRSIRHALAYAGLIRIDHVMGLHRLFWVPEGLGPREGVYVRYPWEELYAILCLESHRNRCVIVGEDLGIVPAEVRAAMATHGWLRTYVLQLDLLEPAGSASEIPSLALASLNTHDLPPFAHVWRDPTPEGSATREELILRLEGAGGRRSGPSLLTEDERGDEPSAPWTEREAWEASLDLLARSEAHTALINVEDLWLETRRQNLPGTQGGTNWRRKARHSLEELGDFEGPLHRVDDTRRGELWQPEPTSGAK